MIRLIDALLIKASSCPPLETHLMSIKMQLWPPFQASFKATISHLTKMASGTVGGSGSFFGAGRATVKEGAIFDAAKEYSGLFNAMIAVAPADVAEDESDAGGLVTFGASLAANESMKVFGDLRQVRETLVGVVKAQAGRATSAEAGRTFQVKAYQGVLHDLMVAGRASVPRCQAEIAHWRELLRKVA